MPQIHTWPTLRTREITLSCDVSADVAGHWAYFNPFPGGSGGSHRQSFLDLSWLWFRVVLSSEVSGPGGFMRIGARLTSEIGGWAADEAVWDSGLQPGPEQSLSQDVSGTIRLRVEAAEWASARFEDDWPSYGGAKQINGPPESTIRFFEEWVPGSTAHLSVMLGPLSINLDQPLTPDFLQTAPLLTDLYTPRHLLTALAFSDNSTWAGPQRARTHFTSRWEGHVLSAPYHRQAGPLLAACDEGLVAEANIPKGAGQHTAVLDASVCPPREYRMHARLRSMHQPYPGELKAMLKATAAPPVEWLLNPETDQRVSQARWSAVARFNGATQPSGGADDWVPVSLWLQNAALSLAGEDVRDWRCLASGKQFDAFEATHASSFSVDSGDEPTAWVGEPGMTVSGAAGAVRMVTTGPASAARSFDPHSNWEGYRFLRVRLRSVGAAGVACALEVGSKRWNLTTGANGGFVDVDLDLCVPHNKSEVSDDQTTRHPLDGPDGAPLWDGPYWGLNRVSSLTFRIDAAATIEIDSIRLVREQPPTVTACPSFGPWLHAWTSPSDTTFRNAGVWLNSDGRVSDLADLARVVPLSGPATHPTYTLADLGAFAEMISGWTWTNVSDPLDGFHSVARFAYWLYGAGALRNHIDGTWQPSFDLSAAEPLRLPAQSLYDSVEGYPLIGNAWGGTSYPIVGLDDVALPMAWNKVLRAQAWGLALRSDAPEPLPGATVKVFEELDPGTERGSGISDAWGQFLTGLPGPRGNRQVRIELQSGASPFPSITRQFQNRFRRRAVLRAGALGRAWHLTKARDGTLFAAGVAGGSVEIWRFDFRGSDASFSLPLAEVTQAQLACHPRGRLVLLAVSAGAAVRLVSESRAESWSMPTTISPAENAALAIDDLNAIEYYAVHSGTQWVLWRKHHPNAEPSLVGPIVAASTANAGLEVSPDPSRRLVFVYDFGGVRRRLVSFNQGLTWVEG